MKYPTVTLNGVNVRIDSAGRYNLNDLHKSAVEGGKAKESQRPGEFLKSRQITRFVQELASATIIAPVRTINGGKILAIGELNLLLSAMRHGLSLSLRFRFITRLSTLNGKRHWLKLVAIPLGLSTAQ